MKSILIFGSLLGAFLCVNLFYTVNLCYNNPDFVSNDTLGWIVMFAVLSLIYFGTNNYRNKELNGSITFLQALKIGALIALLGSTIYVVVWLFYYYLFVPDFIDKYSLHVLKQAAREGASASDIIAKTKAMKDLREMYQNPLMITLLTYLEVFPAGLIVALISSFILRKK